MHLVCYDLVFITVLYLIKEQEGFVIEVDNKRLVNYGIEAILDKYIKPLKKIQASFPDHKVEFQLELLASPQPLRVLRQPRRRFIKMMRPIPPSSYRRTNDDEGIEKKVVSRITTPTVTEAISSQSAPSSVITNTTPATSATTIVTTSDPNKVPVYMEDLHKAISEIEKKISSAADVQTTSYPTLSTNPATQSPMAVNKNLEDILKLLKIGDLVKRNVAKPTNDNLNWVQIRIPKNF